jgi:hypothetical protein
MVQQMSDPDKGRHPGRMVAPPRAWPLHQAMKRGLAISPNLLARADEVIE